MANPAYNLNHWVGVQVGALIPMLNPGPLWITIHNVEAGGLWIESDQLPISFIRGKDDFDDEGKVVFFVPYAQIIWIATLDLKKVSKRAPVLNFNDQNRSGGAGAMEGECE